jgi:putative transposase
LEKGSKVFNISIKGVQKMIENFDLFCKDKCITEEQKIQINNIRTSDPARRVKSGVKNVPGFYSSKKMGLTIQFESHKLELCAIYLMEFDDDVYEFYDQPPSFKINYQINGRNRGHRYTADFFVISKDFIGWEEWKTEEELSKLIQVSPDRYKLDENGQWRCPPAEEFAREHGLSFRIRSSKEINWTLQNNIRFLEDYLLEQEPSVSLVNRNIVLNYIRSTPEVTLEDLLSIEDAPFTADDIYRLVILGEIFVDLDQFLITNFNKFPLFIDREVANAFLNAENSFQSGTNIILDNKVTFEVGGNILWSGNLWTVINIGESEISLLDETEKIISLPISSFEELIKRRFIKSFNSPALDNEEDKEYKEIMISASPAELKRANEKFFILRKHMDGEKVDIPERTLRDWKQKYLRAETKHGRGFVGLIPARYRQGNHTRRLSQDVINLMGKYIEENYEDKRQPDKSSVYNVFKEECKGKGYDPPTLKTFIKEIEKRPKHEQDEKRMGRKGAYGSEPVYWELSLTTPRHGSRPFELAHIDHTKLDIELICSKTQTNLGRPWLSLLIDAFSRRVLAFYLTFDEPSYRSCMMTIRECVRKFSRMPKTIIVDGGRDFQGTYFETLLAHFDCHKKTRPGGKPRYGSVCERLFGTTNTMFINNLMGNTQMTKNVRQMTKEVNPKGLAIWTLEALYEKLSKFLYEIYDNKPHTSLNQSPRDAYQQNIRKTGERKQTYINYDANFEILALPTTTKGTAKVQPGNGIKINKVYYNSYELLDPSVEGKQVPVRFDPFDYSIAYAYVNKRWVKLNSQYELEFKGITQKEMKIATEELKKRMKNTQDSVNISASDLAKFFKGTEAHEQLELQRLKDEAVKKTFKVYEGGKCSLSLSKKIKQTESQGKNKPNNKKYEENIEKVTSKETADFVLYEEFF